MQFNNVTDICTDLMRKARSFGFLRHTAENVEKTANKFIDDFSTEHQMIAHSISPGRWYFQSATHMYEDGVIELQCPLFLRSKIGSSSFEFIDLSQSKITQKR